MLQNHKLNILFVDDEENIIHGIKRMMNSMKKEWNILFATDGNNALEILKKGQIDVIISDLKMPGMDGTTLLKKVKNIYPQVVRITLSGYVNDHLAMDNSKLVHQSLPKPTSAQNLRQTIERAHKLRVILNNQEMFSLINSLDELPSLPEIYLEIEKEINSNKLSIDHLSKIINHDPLICAKILQLTNSAFFGIPHRISNIKEALNYLGIKIIKNLILSIKLFRVLEPNHPNTKIYHQIFDHSNLVASLAKKLSTLNNESKTIIEDAYLGGLLHDIGKLILVDKFKTHKFNSLDELNNFELKELKINHTIIGSYLLGIWGIPDTIVDSSANHHHLNFTKAKLNQPSTYVYIANKMINLGFNNFDEINENNIDEIFTKYLSDVEEK